ncbi:hypothetical protein B0H19DRAFT_1258104 [Mycena capillaripes]|nr:hypothetical protein B0H19DRAFT_1258104 [Mycena capillaripes]
MSLSTTSILPVVRTFLAMADWLLPIICPVPLPSLAALVLSTRRHLWLAADSLTSDDGRDVARALPLGGIATRIRHGRVLTMFQAGNDLARERVA